MLQRVAIFGGGLVLLLILVIVFVSILTSGGKEKTQDLLTIAQEQTELIRVATDGTTHATTQPMQNLAQNVQASITSDNVALLAYMKNTGQKVAPKQLVLKHNNTTDTTLTTAQENSTYDSAFKDVIQTDLDAYGAALHKAIDANPGPKGKAILTQQYEAAKLLYNLSKQ
jgi:hypothetical protein